VQGSLCMFPILRYGSAEQKDHWLPRMAQGETIGCYGLTEPDAGSDPGAMKTHAVQDGEDWILNGAKMWITNSPVADLAVVWATTERGDPTSIRGFLVERGMPGLTTPTTRRKMSLRASETGEIVLSDCRVPASHVLPEARGLGAPLSCLNQARFGIAFGVLGAGFSVLEESLRYLEDRPVFGEPLTGKQLVQAKLADMLSDLTKGSLVAYRLGRLKEEGKDTPARVSMAKRDNVRTALNVARMGRDLLGGNGVTTEYAAIRHMSNLESVFTYEGADHVHTLILGREITGRAAF